MPLSEQLKDTVAALVMFYSPEDTASVKMLPVLQKVKQAATGSVKVLKINVEEDTRTVAHEKLTELPSFAVYRYGRCVWRKSGIISAAELLERLEASADPDPAGELGHHHRRRTKVATA